MKPHHLVLIGQVLTHIDSLNERIARVQQAIEQVQAPFTEAITLLQTIPGLGEVVAMTLVAEIGTDIMSRFPSAKHLASWAGPLSARQHLTDAIKVGRELGNAEIVAACVGALARLLTPSRADRNAPSWLRPVSLLSTGVALTTYRLESYVQTLSILSNFTTPPTTTKRSVNVQSKSVRPGQTNVSTDLSVVLATKLMS